MSYMVNLVLEGKVAVVVGGGPVAGRKVESLLAAKANVTVIAPRACDRIAELARDKRVVLHSRPYRTEDLEGAAVAIAATGDEAVNARVAKDAGAWNVPVNVVDRPALCTFTVPATLCRGDLTLAVATEGRCPTLAGILREELEQRYGPEYASLVTLFGELRARMISLDWDGLRVRGTLLQIYRAGALEKLAAGNRGLLHDFLRSHLGPEFPLPE
jgi:precorrin-2 dehydrogenase/sirohydrochlorin ferrochelatase